MDYTKIRELVKKYWAGETSLNEEKQLIEFFSSADGCPQDLMKEKALFKFLGEESHVPDSKDDLTTKLRHVWEHPVKTAPHKSMKAWRSVLKYAAVMVPLFVASYFLFLDKHPAQPQEPVVALDTYTDPKQAIAETEKALMLLSKNMNDGLASVEALKLLKEVEKTHKKK